MNMNFFFPALIGILLSLSFCYPADQTGNTERKDNSEYYYMTGLSPISLNGFTSETTIQGSQKSFLPMAFLSIFWNSTEDNSVNNLSGITAAGGYTYIRKTALFSDIEKTNYTIPWISLSYKKVLFFSKRKNAGFYFTGEIATEYLLILKENNNKVKSPSNIGLAVKIGGGYSYQTNSSSILIGVETDIPYSPIFIFRDQNKNYFFRSSGIYPYVSILW